MDVVTPANTATARMPAAAIAGIAAGVSATFYLEKLPPVVPALQVNLGISLVGAGFLLSLVQAAGTTLGLLLRRAADTVGLRRSVSIGSLRVTVASVGRACVAARPKAVLLLLALCALEGLGCLLVVMPAPELIHAVIPVGVDKLAMGFWGAYMPKGGAVALLLGPLLISAVGWQGWWRALLAVSASAYFYASAAARCRPCASVAIRLLDDGGRSYRSVCAMGSRRGCGGPASGAAACGLLAVLAWRWSGAGGTFCAGCQSGAVLRDRFHDRWGDAAGCGVRSVSGALSGVLDGASRRRLAVNLGRHARVLGCPCRGRYEAGGDAPLDARDLSVM